MPRTDEIVDWLEPAHERFPRGLPPASRNTVRVMFRLLRDAFDADPHGTISFIRAVLRLLRIQLHAGQQMERHRIAKELRAENDALRERIKALEFAADSNTELTEMLHRLIGPHGAGQDST